MSLYTNFVLFFNWLSFGTAPCRFFISNFWWITICLTLGLPIAKMRALLFKFLARAWVCVCVWESASEKERQTVCARGWLVERVCVWMSESVSKKERERKRLRTQVENTMLGRWWLFEPSSRKLYKKGTTIWNENAVQISSNNHWRRLVVPFLGLIPEI